MFRFILFLLLSLPVFSLHADNGFTEVKSPAAWEKIVQLAKAKNKLILVDMYTDWCGYCKLMDRNVFSDEDYQQELAVQYLTVKIDGDSGYGGKFVADYDIQGFPTFLFFDKQGKLIDQLEGYQDLTAFRAATMNIFDRNTDRKKLQKKYKKGKLKDAELAHYYTLINDSAKKKKIEDKLFAELNDATLVSGPYDAFLFASSTALKQRGTQLILGNRAVFEERNGVIVYEKFIEQLFNKSMDEVVESGDQVQLTKLETELLPVYVNDVAALPQARLIFKKLYHANRKEWTQYEKVVEQQWQAYPDPNQYYNEAYALLDGYVDDSEAMALSESWIQKSINEAANFQSYLLLCVIQLMQGKELEGIESLEKAQQLAITEEEKEQVNELKRMIEQS